MKVLLLSDTHGDYAFWEKLVENNFWSAELIIHAGDVTYHGPRNDLPPNYAPKKLIAALNDSPVPLIIAAGNCDAYVDQMTLDWPLQSPYVFVYLEGKRIIVNHGHLLDDEEKCDLAKKYKADFFITGHTHIPVLKRADGVVYINPGSTSISKREDKLPTCALLEDKLVTLLNLQTGAVLETLSL